VYLITSTKKPLTISIVRKTLPALKGSVLRDIMNILQETGIYYLGVHNKAENTFKYNNHLIEFLSVDEPQKIRGRKRNIAFLNEGNELNIEDFRQINMRTTDMVIVDFNPSDPVHWIYSDLIPRDDCDTWITTYRDNNFLSTELVNEIERMKERDPDYWRVYGEGLQAIFSARQVFNNWEFIDYKDFPEFDLDVEGVIGIDYGYSNDPTAVVLTFRQNDKLYIHELLFRKGMTNSDIVDFLKSNGYGQVICYADSAEPKSIEEMRRLGMFIKPAVKGQGSINAGISLLKEYDVIVSKESQNILREYHNYYWEELKDGTIINKPQDKENHTMDSIRYAVYSRFGKRENFFVI
jgi:phage terminase large subunit|tara:strand:+ start:1297 stop:2349 length:1053 start_codon:yes stop_codon:yes gene_type:complete